MTMGKKNLSSLVLESLLLFVALTTIKSAHGFSPATINRSSCSITFTAVKNFQACVTAFGSRSLFSSKESSDENESEFNFEGDGDNTAAASNIIPQQPATSRRKQIDPLIASLTRIDEPTPANVPMRSVPLFGEVPADGNLALLLPAAGIAILGFMFSIVVAFNAKDEIVSELSKVELPKMEYIPTVVEEGTCRGLCSSQEDDLDGLRTFMESISKKSD
jgi:hypothetical protein